MTESRAALSDREMEAALEAALRPLRQRSDRAIEAVLSTWSNAPSPLGEAMTYGLTSGGKRIRPILVFAAYDACGGGDPDAAAPAAAALEMVHAYSLAHDDLPAMDDDDERRGRPTLHVAYDEATAILVGDALLTDAFSVIAGAPYPPTIAISSVAALAEAAGSSGMVGGQVLDIRVPAPTYNALREMHAAKTGALFRCACALGAIVAGASPAMRATLTEFGALVGEAFQISDDLVDFLDIDAAGEHEMGVNMVSILGVDGVIERVENACRTALEGLDALPGPIEPLATLVEWIRRRAYDVAERVAP